jgi:hypothetical protein
MKDKIFGIIIRRLCRGKKKYRGILVGKALGVLSFGGAGMVGREGKSR